MWRVASDGHADARAVINRRDPTKDTSVTSYDPSVDGAFVLYVDDAASTLHIIDMRADAPKDVAVVAAGLSFNTADIR